MAKVIVAIPVPLDVARKIEVQGKNTHKVEYDEHGVPTGYFNEDGRVVLSSGLLEEDFFDNTFCVFEYLHVNYDD